MVFTCYDQAHMNLEQPQPLSEPTPDTEHDPDYQAKLRKERELQEQELSRKEEMMRLEKVTPLDVKVKVEPSQEEIDEEKPSGERHAPVIPPTESGPVTVRSEKLPEPVKEEEPSKSGIIERIRQTIGISSSSAKKEISGRELQDSERASIQAAPESGIRPAEGEISVQAMEAAKSEEEKRAIEDAKKHNLPPYGPSVIEEEAGEEEERREAA